MAIKVFCDLCGTEATRLANSQNYKYWPEDGGCAITLTFNHSSHMQRELLVCPSCSRKHNLPHGAGRTHALEKEEKEDLLDKLAEIVFQHNEEGIADIARDVYDDRDSY